MIARFRLLLAVLALALAPVVVPAASLAAPVLAAPALAAMAGDDGACTHPCDDATIPHHQDMACAAACGLSATLAPLLLPVGVVTAPGSAVQRQPAFRALMLSATLRPPPVRPPRA